MIMFFFKDYMIKILFKEKFLGKKTFKGFLQGVDENKNIILKTDDHEIKIKYLEIEKANIDPDWAIQNNKIN